VANFGAKYGLDLDLSAVEELLTYVVGGVYYVVVRAAEHYLAPSFGWLLGVAKEPQYGSNL
jgi:hypothetical protein